MQACMFQARRNAITNRIAHQLERMWKSGCHSAKESEVSVTVRDTEMGVEVGSEWAFTQV